jgi:hypothetical protein
LKISDFKNHVLIVAIYYIPLEFSFFFTVLFFIKQMHAQKRNFNNRLLALRAKKIQIIREINDLVSQVQKIQSVLGPELSKPVPEIPKMFACEMPER